MTLIDLGAVPGDGTGDSRRFAGQKINALVPLIIKSATTTTPPTGALENDRFIIPAGATGDWAGKTNQIAAWQPVVWDNGAWDSNGGWLYITPFKGLTGSNENALTVFRFDGVDWSETSLQGLPGVGDMLSSNNLNDVANKETARNNLELGDLALLDDLPDDYVKEAYQSEVSRITSQEIFDGAGPVIRTMAPDDVKSFIDQHTTAGVSAGRNMIINGNFRVNQRGVSGTVVLAAEEYSHDRWKAGSSGCTYTFSNTENVTTITITAGSLQQIIEDINLFTDDYTLSWVGTAQGKIGAGAYETSPITNSITGGANLTIEFGIGTLSNVQFEKGDIASDFELRHIARELELCRRYYIENYGIFCHFGDSGLTQQLPNEMRVTPTATRTGPCHTGAENIPSSVSANKNRLYIHHVSLPCGGTYQLDAEL